MSSIDNRIVRMQFDNDQFERGVMQSMRTLDELNEKLQFKEAGKGISALQVHLNNVDFSGIQNAVQHINHSFTSMTGMVAQRIKEDIVDNVINAAKRLEQVTLGQIKSGGRARAQNIANAKFMIEGLKFDWEAVKQAADYAVTDTAYGLDAAAKAASQLAASGVDFQETIETVNGQDLTQMHKSLRAISGVAAMTNASYEEIAHIFTSVAGMGKLTAMQMNQLSLRGLNIASTIGQETGKTEQEIREMVSKGEISFQMFADAMDSAYGDHAKDANKTFQGSFSNLKAALSRIGAIFQQPVIDKTNTFFVSVTGRIKEFQKALNDVSKTKLTEQGLKKVKKQAIEAANATKLFNKDRQDFIDSEIKRLSDEMLANENSFTNGDAEKYTIYRFATHFAEAWESAVNFASKVVETLDLSWFQSIGGFLDKAAIKATNFFGTASKAIDKVKASVDKASGSITDTLELDMQDLDLLHRILYNEFGFVEERWAKLDKIYKEQGSTKTGLWLQGYMDQLAGVGYHFEKLGWTEEEFKKKQEELAKSEAQRVAGMSKEEVVLAEITEVFLDTKRAMEGVRKTIGNILKSIGNLGLAIGKVLLSFRSFSAGLHPEDLADRFARISEAIYHFTEVLQPSESALQKIMEVSQDVGNVFNDVTEFVTNTVVAFIDFVASCLKADESLDELAKNESLTSMQRAVLDVMRVINNLRRFLVALGKIAIKIFKSVKTAFMNVFGGQELGGALTAITGSFTLLTDGIATAAEKVAESEAPFKAIEYVFGTIFSVIRKVSDLLGKFTTGIRKFKNGTEDTLEITDKALKAGEKSTSLFESLGKAAGKGFQWLEELPGKMKQLLEAVKKQEGVQKLKTSLENLWKTIKETVNKGIDPMTKGMEGLARTTGGEGETVIEAVANGIGKFADKIAEYIDKLPEYGAKIKKFFEDIKKWFDKTIKDLHLDELGEGISGAFADIFASDESIFVKVKKFAERIFDTIVKTLDKVDWKEIGKGGMMTLVAANLFNFFRVTSGISDTIAAIKTIPEGIFSVFKSLKTLFGEAQKALGKVANAYVFLAMAQGIVLLASAIVILSDIQKDKLNKALAAVTFLGAIVIAMIHTIGKMIYGLALYKEANSKVIDNSTKNLLQINQSIGMFAGVALLLAGAGGAIWLVAKAVTLINEMTKSTHDKKGAISAAIQTIIDIAVILGILVLAMVVLMKIAKGSGSALEGVGVALIGLTVAIYGIVGAFWLLDKINISGKTITAVIGIVASVIVMTYVLGTVARWADTGALLALALDMVVFSFALGVILAEILVIAGLMSAGKILKTGDTIFKATAVVCGLILALGGAFFLMGKGMARVKNPKEMMLPILSMAGVIVAIGWTLSKVAEATKANPQGTVIAFFAMVAILGLVVMAIDNTNKQIRRGKVSESAQVFAALAGVFAAVGVCLLLMAYAVNKMQGVHAGYILAAIGIIAVVSIAMGLLAKSVGSQGSAVAEILESMAIAFVAIGASMLLIAEAANVMSGVNPLAFAGVVIVMGLMIAAFVALAILVGKNNKMSENLVKVGKAFRDFGLSMFLIGASALIFGIAIGIIASGFGLLANGIGVLAKAFNEHKVTVIVLITIIALITILAALLIKSIEPIPPLITKVADSVVDTAGKAGGGLLNVLKGGASKIGDWWKGMQPKTKAMIVTGIGTLCAAILKASPQLLNTAKALLGKLIGFLIDVIPDLVKGIVAVLIKLINAVANEIRANSAKIAFAVWNLLEALFEVVLEVVGQMILMFTGTSGPLGKIGQTIVDSMSESKGYLRKNLAEIEAYAEAADEEANEAMSKFLEKGAKSGDIWAQTAIDMQEFKKEVGDTTDAVNEHTDAMQTYFEAAAKGAKTRIPGIPIEVENVDMTGKFIGNTLGKETASGFEDTLGKVGLDPSAVLPDGNTMEQYSFDMGEYGGEGLINGYDTALDEGTSETYTTTTTTIQDGPVAAIEDSAPEVRKTTREFVNDVIRDEISDEGYRKTLETRMWSNGGYLLRGFSGGIDAHLYMVKDSMNRVATLTNGSFIGPMKINSPSKLFYENGQFILQGLANGIAASTKLAEDAAGTASNDIITSFRAPLDYISKMASGELQYDPTIRPVLDSSSIGRGAGAINSMFRNQNVSLSGFSGQLAADIGQLDSRNSDVVEEIRALREEMAQMGEDISNMQVVMDTGALVGATAGPMDKALGQRAVRFGRGN